MVFNLTFFSFYLIALFATRKKAVSFSAHMNGSRGRKTISLKEDEWWDSQIQSMWGV